MFLTATTAAPVVAGVLACLRMSDPKYEDKTMNKNKQVSDYVLRDLYSFSYPRAPGGPSLVYNNIGE